MVAPPLGNRLKRPPGWNVAGPTCTVALGCAGDLRRPQPLLVQRDQRRFSTGCSHLFTPTTTISTRVPTSRSTMGSVAPPGAGSSAPLPACHC